MASVESTVKTNASKAEFEVNKKRDREEESQGAADEKKLKCDTLEKNDVTPRGTRPVPRYQVADLVYWSSYFYDRHVVVDRKYVNGTLGEFYIYKVRAEWKGFNDHWMKEQDLRPAGGRRLDLVKQWLRESSESRQGARDCDQQTQVIEHPKTAPPKDANVDDDKKDDFEEEENCNITPPRPLCNVHELKKYDAEFFGYLSKGENYSGFMATGYSDMLKPRGDDEACKKAFIKIVEDMHEQFGDMVAIAHALLEKVRAKLQTTGGTQSNQEFPINMPVHLNGKDVKIGIRGWNLTSKVTSPDGTTVMFGHNRPFSVEEHPDEFKKLLPAVNGDKRIAELYQAGGSFMLLACGFTQEKKVRGGDNPYYLGPEILKKFGLSKIK